MLVTALIMGFAGSIHCMGMCSPLAIAVTHMTPGIFLNKLIYNLGRILMYSLFGAVVSLAGKVLPISGYQNLISLTLGVILLMVGVSGLSIKLPLVAHGLQQLSMFLKKQFAHFLQQKNYRSVFILGLFNGMLPCGLTFLALTFCLALTGPLEGFIFMMLFGMGTLPAMFGLPILWSAALKKLKWNLNKVTTVLLIASGGLLIARVFLVAASHAHSVSEGIDIVLCR